MKTKTKAERRKAEGGRRKTGDERRTWKAFELASPFSIHGSPANSSSILRQFRPPPSAFRLSSCRGFTLIELVAVISMLSVLLLVIAATLWGAVKIERADSAAFQRMTVQAQLADQFREDVRQAIECPDSIKDLSAGPSCLILKMEENRHVVYRWAEDRLSRAEFAGADETTVPWPVGGERISVIFGRSAAEDHVVWMRLLDSRGAGSSSREWPVEIRAAVGDDRQ